MKLPVILMVIAFAMVNAEEKNRGKRQQVYYTRRGGRPPPYAVQMEPIVQYSQRDPLYNPLANSKSDDDFYHDETLGHAPGPYSSEPEPIIEIIIKESNESLPTSAPPVIPTSKPTKEPIQVYYVKYEKKDQGNGKSKVVYDKPVPALTPHEEHEEIKSENQLTEKTEYVTQSPLLNEPSTTLRAIIRPDSEIYHSDGSGIKITFGSDKLPPNNHNKRSDRDNPNAHPQLYLNSFSPSPIGNKRPVGQFPVIQANHRLPQSQVTFPQQRITSFSQHQQQQQLPQQQLPPNFSQPQFQTPPLINVQRQQQRPAITIQGLPEVQQRFTFQSFNSPAHGIRINHPQQPGFPPAVSVSHQSIHLQNQPHFSGPNNFNGEQIHSQRFQQQQQQQHQLFKQEQDRKLQELKQREQFRQQDLQRQQDQQFQEKQRQQHEQQRFKQQETKIREQYNQQQQQQVNINRVQHQQRQQQQIQQQQQQQIQQQQQQIQQQQQQQIQQQQEKQSEILRAVPKLEQHYAFRENPLHPGPFPPNSQIQPIQFSQTTHTFPGRSQTTGITIQKQNFVSQVQSGYVPKTNSQTPAPKFPNQKEGFFSQSVQSQQPSSQYQSIWGQPIAKDPKQKIFATPVPKTENYFPRFASASPALTPTTTTTTTTTPSPTTAAPTTTTTPSPKNEAKIKQNIANLPDEVPDDIRDQLLSSGILGNADIQVLDYDKVGDIPIENLPPEALANFYGAGGGAVAASAPVPSIAKKPKIIDDGNSNNKNSYNNNNNNVVIKPNKAVTTTTKVEQATLKPGGVEMKVVHFDPNTAQGQAIADQHIRDDATHLKPVNVVPSGDDNTQYNRYLPLKVSGASFPIPDVPELKDRKISSVVVLAPVDYNFRDEEQRYGKKIGEPMPAKFLAGDTLKQLIRKPTAENYKKWLEQESQTEPQKQSVVLLVTTPKNQSKGEKEIFMYDVSSQGVSKLSGDLSSAFVDAAESNSESPEPIDDSSFTS